MAIMKFAQTSFQAICMHVILRSVALVLRGLTCCMLTYDDLNKSVVIDHSSGLLYPY